MATAMLSTLTLLLVVVGGAARAEDFDRPKPRIVNGVLAGDHPSTGALLRGLTADTASTWCSGTLIGCSTFLTAGHCVAGRTASEFHVYLPNAGIFAVQSIAHHPAYDFPAADVAVLKLATPVVGVAPSAIETTSAPPPGTAGVIVGYGRSGDPFFDYGLKRAGNVVTATCSGIPSPGSDTTSVCWNFTAPQGPPGSNSNTCNADSGGPLFVDQGDGVRVAGVTSGGASGSCLPTDHSYDANVFTYRSFIETAGGADLANTTCGNVPQAGAPGTVVEVVSGTVSGAVPQATHSFEVTNGTTLLRVAMNGVDDGPSDFDLYVKAGSAPTTSVYDCGRFGQNQFAVCEFPAPVLGTWHVLVQRYSGGGTYQLTATQFATNCTGPETDGNPCDDDNACTSDDACLGSACVGAPVDDGSPCNDDNVCTGPDGCQAGSCVGGDLADGTPCDDGDPCSRPDVCVAGACDSAAPALGCKVAPAQTALLQVENRAPDSRDRLTWTLRKGPLTTSAELGNPTLATPYTLCLYDNVGGVPQRRLTTTIPAGSRWKRYTRGYRYRASTLGAGGLQSIVLTEGASGRSSVQVRGRGPELALPTLPFARQPSVIVQLLNDTTCWSSTYSTSVDNGIARFKAKSD